MAVSPRTAATGRVLYRSEADDRLLTVCRDPERGSPSLLGLRWHLEEAHSRSGDGASAGHAEPKPSVGRARQTVVQADTHLARMLGHGGAESCVLDVFDESGRVALTACFPSGIPAGLGLRDAGSARLASGVYFLRVRGEASTFTNRVLLVP